MSMQESIGQGANSEEIQSPCVGICAMSEETGYCLGCYRTIDEIRNWWDMSNAERQETVSACEQRQIDLAVFD